MKSNRTTAIIVGILILAAYSMLVSEATDSTAIVLLADVISGLAVAGIAVLMYPLFKPFGKELSLGYLVLKIAEGLIMIAGGLLFLSESTQSLRSVLYDGVHLYTFIAGGFLFYYLLYKSKLVPRLLSVWGGVAILALLVITILKSLDMSNPTLESMLVLIIANEVTLALWLMVKGFNEPATKEAPDGK